MAVAKAEGRPGSRVVMERFVDGTEQSAEVLIWRGETSVLCVSEKVKSRQPYRVDLSVQYPAAFSPEQEQQVARVLHEAVVSLGLSQGVAHVEFAFTRAGPVLFELGARCGGGHTPQIAHHVSGTDEFVEVCRMACGIPPERFRPTRKLGADYRFVILRPGRIRQVEIPAALRHRPDILDLDITLGPGDSVQPLRTTSQRAGFLVCTGPDARSAATLADWACQQIQVTYDDGSQAPPCSIER